MDYVKLALNVAFPVLVLTLGGVVNFQCDKIETLQAEKKAVYDELSRAKKTTEVVVKHKEIGELYILGLMRDIVKAHDAHRERMESIEKAAKEDPSIDRFLDELLPDTVLCALRDKCRVHSDSSVPAPSDD